MNRISILAGGTVLAAVVLCGGAVTMANAMTRAPGSQVLTIAGVSTSPSATPSATPTASDVPTATPTPTAAPTADPGDVDGNGNGVTVVAPSDPTKIDGKGCAHMVKPGSGDPAKYVAPVTGAYDPAHHMIGTPVPQDPKYYPKPGTSGGVHPGVTPYPGAPYPGAPYPVIPYGSAPH